MTKTIKYLITGADGQLGQCLVRRFEENTESVILALSHHELDICNKQSVFKIFLDFKPDVVINTAAYTNVDLSETLTSLAHNVNVEGVKNLSEASKQTDSILFHISTDYVFNGQIDDNYVYKESDKPEPLSVYGKTKYEGERIALSLNPKTVVIRTAWTFSEYGHNFVKTILKLAREQNELNIVSDQFGGPTYAGDIAVALINISQQIISGKHNAFGIYHFTGKPYVSWYEFAKAILMEAELQKVIEKSPIVNSITSGDYLKPAKRPRNSCLDLTKIKQVFDIEPSNWPQALKNIKGYIS
ncbi:dTDP-4-dehydrorhamnose reductase [Pelistega suis]|uniref:dTDP-4-dehydrorhamnose reductase n=1 Tax=Pelistega suis TaxID=1631957 RepID=UPI00211C7D6A|nr:dTDP-4-dehydrorhamnose reductase [Pelistega suis]MCQ9328040.1 dTDP-4-dehydrorhamnose reductase [Pelistega suis]